MQLHNYQRNIVRFLIMHDHAILSVDMGLGKTAATLQWLDLIKPASAVIVAPKRVAETTWAQEAKKWGFGIADKFVIVKGKPANRAYALRDKEHPYKVISRDNLKDVQGAEFEALIIDELTSFKSIGSKRTQAIMSIKADYVVGLTGTFLANGAIDIYGQAAACGLKMPQDDFYAWRANNFRDCLKGSGLSFEKWIPTKPMRKILEPIADSIYTLTAEDYLEIPAVSHTTHKIDVGEEVKAAIGDLDAFLSMEIGGETVAFKEGQKFAKLQTLCNGFVYVGEEQDVMRGSESRKLEEVADFVADCKDQGEPVLLFYAFREEERWLKELLKARGVKTASVRDPNFMEWWNAGSIECLMAHPASAGHGLNLQHGGRIIVWSTLTYNYEYYAQANARLARQGQTRNVQVHYFIAEGTVEERVVRALQDKDETQKEFLKITKQ